MNKMVALGIRFLTKRVILRRIGEKIPLPPHLGDAGDGSDPRSDDAPRIVSPPKAERYGVRLRRVVGQENSPLAVRSNRFITACQVFSG